MRYQLFCSVLFFALLITKTFGQSLESKELNIYQIGENVWVHVTYLETEKWGRVACNGMIYKVENEAVIFDTPVTNKVSKLLIDWVEDELNAKISAVVVNHHHIDCLGGIETFHKQGIPSYGHPKENELALSANGVTPQLAHASEGSDTLHIGDQMVINFNPGAAHTQSSLISYLPETQTIFGGCQVKALGAGKGNLNDADTVKWPISLRKVKVAFPETKKVIPGHGKVGGSELLDYTIELFSSNSN